MEKPTKEFDNCLVFDPARWSEQTITWENKMFIRGNRLQILHFLFPGSMKRIMRKLWKQATEAGAEPDQEDFLILAYDQSPWNCEFYLPVTHAVPGADNVNLSGTYFTRVFDGPYSMIAQYINEMDILLAQQNLFARRYFFYSAACPLCERKYLTNNLVAFAEIAND